MSYSKRPNNVRQKSIAGDVESFGRLQSISWENNQGKLT